LSLPRGRALRCLLAGASLVASSVLATSAAAATPATAVNPVPPNQGLAPPASLGRAERGLDLLAVPGMVSAQWATPFGRATGCKVSVTVASPAVIATDMAQGGVRKFDLVGASDDVTPALIYGGTVRPINLALLPEWPRLATLFQSPASNTVSGYHYGVAVDGSADVLVYSRAVFGHPPTSWSTLYPRRSQRDLAVPDDPLQIAAAAVYLRAVHKSLGITDPLELTARQFDAVVTLLRAQHASVRTYWRSESVLASQLSSHAVAAAAAPLSVLLRLGARSSRFAAAVPREGVTGRIFSWLMDAKPRHPNCAYRWLRWVTSPRIQAQLALSTGSVPANPQSCATLDSIHPGSCATLRATSAASILGGLTSLRTPTRICPTAKPTCVAFKTWQQIWATIDH